MISNEKMPNVYIENPDLIQKENVTNKPKRLQSAKKPTRGGRLPSAKKY